MICEISVTHRWDISFPVLDNQHDSLPTYKQFSNSNITWDPTGIFPSRTFASFWLSHFHPLRKTRNILVKFTFWGNRTLIENSCRQKQASKRNNSADFCGALMALVWFVIEASHNILSCVIFGFNRILVVNSHWSNYVVADGSTVSV